MKNLSDYLGLLTPKEVKRFVDYLNSPFFNADARLVGLYLYIQKAASRDTECISAIKLFKKLGFAMDAKQLLQAIRDLTDYLKDFLVHAHIQTDERLRLLVFNTRVRNQGQRGIVAEVVAKRKKALAKAPLDMGVLMEDWSIDHQGYYEYDTDHEGKGLEDLHTLQQKLDQLSAAARAMYACEALHLRRAAHQSTVAPSVQLPNVLTQMYDLNRAVFEASLADFDPALEHFTTAFHEAASSGHISSLNAYVLAKYTIHTLSKAVNAGQVQRMEQLYAWQLVAEQYQPKPIRRIPSGEFLNRVNTGCYLKRLDDTVAYIQRSSPHLAPETRALAAGIANMYVLFEQEKYADILRMIDTEYSRRIASLSSYNLRMKAIRLKAATELRLAPQTNEEDYFEKVDEDLKKYLSRNKELLSVDFYQRYSNLLNLARNIVKIKEGVWRKAALQEACGQLLLKIETTQPIISKDWLIQKVNFVAIGK